MSNNVTEELAPEELDTSEAAGANDKRDRKTVTDRKIEQLSIYIVDKWKSVSVSEKGVKHIKKRRKLKLNS